MASSRSQSVPPVCSADSASRSLLKAVSWRLSGSCGTVVLAWLITGHAGKAFSIGLAELVAKGLLYYLHERLWNRVALGRQVVPLKGDYEI